MDTRNKIFTTADAVAALRLRSADSPLTVMTGYFDPLLAAHARRLNELAASAGKLIVVLENPERPILPQRARAELVAALKSVAYVVLAERSAEEFLSNIPKAGIVREGEADTRRAEDFIRHVLDKQMVPQG